MLMIIPTYGQSQEQFWQGPNTMVCTQNLPLKRWDGESLYYTPSIQDTTIVSLFIPGLAGDAEEVERSRQRCKAGGEWENPRLLYATHDLHQRTHHQVKVTPTRNRRKWTGESKAPYNAHLTLRATFKEKMFLSLSFSSHWQESPVNLFICTAWI